MPRQKSRTFTDVELEFMKILWDHEEITPDEVRNALSQNGRTISIGSIRNVLSIMMKKGYITRKKKGKAYLYEAKIMRKKARKTMIQDLLVHAFDGSESEVVAALLDNHRINRREFDEIKRLIEDYREEEN